MMRPSGRRLCIPWFHGGVRLSLRICCMIKLEQLQPSAAVRAIVPDVIVVVVSVQWFGSEALELTYKTPTGKVANELLLPSRRALARPGGARPSLGLRRRRFVVPLGV